VDEPISEPMGELHHAHVKRGRSPCAQSKTAAFRDLIVAVDRPDHR
jgi:hypothetical protein